MKHYPNRSVGRVPAVLLLAASLFLSVHAPGARAQAADAAEIEIALSLADMLRAAREVISDNQALINDPNVGEKGLTGDVVLAKSVEKYRRATGEDVAALDPQSRKAKLLQGQMEAIREIIDENQSTMNEKGLGFKGIIPAVIGRLVSERFNEKMMPDAAMKVTAPIELVRNRKALPDSWERKIIESRFLQPSWERGEMFSEAVDSRGRPAARILVPEYYSASCLACHGEVKGETDITGYPKEGGREGDLGGVISITLYK